MNLASGEVIADRYEIIEKIGHGGMAIVYKAKDTKLDRFVTVKIMREEYISDDEFVDRFETEARSAAKINHPNIVGIYDVGKQDKIHYIVLEYIDGMTLKELIRKKAPFRNEEIIQITKQIAEGLKKAHERKIIHQDIKPENIMVDKKGVVKVTDFGIARSVSESTIAVNKSTLGSVYYFSPEQASGGYVDSRSDIYSLGIVMFEMATGKLPFTGDTPVTIALKHVEAPIPKDMRKFNSNISRSIEKIILKATQKKTINRYSGTGELLNDLIKAETNFSGDFIDDNHKNYNATIRLSDKEEQEIRDKYNKNNLKNSGHSKHSKDKEKSKKSASKSEKKVIFFAVLTSLILIAIIAMFAVDYIKKLQPNPITLPDLVNLDSQDAEITIKRYGLKPKLEYENSETVEMGKVISVNYGLRLEDNQPITELYEGYEITIIVSLGRLLIPVPKVTGKDYDDAYSRLVADGLTNIKKIEQNSSSTAKNIVIDQSPGEGETLDENELITLTVSVGPKKVQLPNFTLFENYEDALAFAKEKNLLLDKLEMHHDTIAKGKIIKQNRNQGEEVEEGTRITVHVSIGPKELTTGEIVVEGNPKPSSTITIDFPAKAEYETDMSVHVVVKALADNKMTPVLDENIQIKNLPYSLSVEGTGVVKYSSVIKFNNEIIYEGSTSVDFDNLGVD